MKFYYEIFHVPFRRACFLFRITHKRSGVTAEEIFEDYADLRIFRHVRKYLIEDINFRLGA